jgi:hypothetical protein
MATILYPARIAIFFSSTASTPVLGPTQSPIQLVTRAVSPGAKRQERVSDYLHLELRSRIVELYLRFPIRLHHMDNFSFLILYANVKQ